MATLTMQVPDDVKALAEAKAAEAGCADVGEYVTQLIRADAGDASGENGGPADAALEALLLERERDDRVIEATPEFWRSLRDEARRRIASATGRP